MAVAMVVVALAYQDTLRGMVGIWSRSETFAHGFVVPPIAAWLAWRLRDTLAGVPFRPWWPALGFLAAAGLAWLLGELAEVNALRQFAVVAMLVLAVPAIAGRDVARHLAFPLSFVFFAVPFGEFLLPRLMDWTASFAVTALRLTGVPVYREGLSFVIPSGHWSVVEACSGVRYLIASVVVGTLFAYLNYRTLARRIAFVGVAILVPLVANWLRAYLIVMLGHVSGNRIAVGVDHLIYGWLFFGLVMAMMFWIGARWREDATVAAARALATPLARDPAGGQEARRGTFIVAAVVYIAVALVPWIANRGLDASSHATVPRLAEGVAVPGWRELPETEGAWRPRYLRPGASRAAAYARNDDRVSTYVAYYRDQTGDSKLISSENVLVPTGDALWSSTIRGTVEAGAGAAVPEVVATDVTGRHGQRLRVWHWYWVDGRSTTSPARAKLATALARLAGRGDDSAVVVIATAQGHEPGAYVEADARLRAFLAAAASPILADLETARKTR